MLPGLYQRMSNRLAQVMGEPVVFVLAGQEVERRAHYRAPWEGHDASGFPVDSQQHTIDIPTAQLPAGVVEGGTVLARMSALRITEISADDGGMTRILAAELRT